MKRFEPSKATDTQLLIQYQDGRDQDAFAELVRRHGEMVRAVGLRVLGNEHDAEDVFQATFLAFAKSADDVREQAAVVGWLYTAAYRCAAKVKRTNASLQIKTERLMSHLKTSNKEKSSVDSDSVVVREELMKALDEELDRLPIRINAAVVLCDLEGKTQKEAAMQLGVSPSTVNDRVVKGRKLLHKRLVRRGLSMGVGGLASIGVASTESTVGAMSEPLIGDMTTKASLYAAGKSASEVGVTSTVFELAAGVSKAMKAGMVITVGVAMLAVALLASSVWGVSSVVSALSPVGTLANEDFSGGIDSSWQVLGPVGLRGTADASSGDLVLTPNPQTANAQVSGLGFGLPSRKSVDMSVRSQVRITETGGSAIVDARLQDKGDEPFGYFAAIGYAPELGGTTFRAGRIDGFETPPTLFLPATRRQRGRERRYVLLPFDIRKKDAVIQLDVIGSRVRAWAWEAGTEMPTKAQFDAIDDTYDDPGYAAVGLQNVSSSKSTGWSTSTFRFIHVADVPIHELD